MTTMEMDGGQVQTLAADVAGQLPGASREQPFGPDWEVFKVAGKVFLLITDVPGESVVVLKCDPEESVALRQAHSTITPGYHMNKRHWITVHGGAGTTAPLVTELVRASYLLVREGLPRSRRPPLPDDLVPRR